MDKKEWARSFSCEGHADYAPFWLYGRSPLNTFQLRFPQFLWLPHVSILFGGHHVSTNFSIDRRKIVKIDPPEYYYLYFP